MWVTRSGALLCACFLSVVAPVGARAAGYLLQPGDVLSLMIVGAPELSRTVPVEMDGTAWFPLIGEIRVSGTSLREVRERVAQAYSATSITQSAGTDIAPALVRPSQVHVSVEEYRPIYVTGDLLEPRTIEFRPGLTLRQAVALTSVGDTGERSRRAVRESIEAVLIDLSRVQARIWSLKKLLGRDAPEDYDNIFVADIEAIEEIAELERSMVAARTAERDQQKNVIEVSIARAEGRLAALEEQKLSEEEGWRLDEQIASEVRDLFSKGSPLAPASRLAEVRRSALVSASRVLQLEVAAENVRTELADLRAQAAAVEAGAQSDTWSELSDALALAKQKRAELVALQSASTSVIQGESVAVITRGGVVLPPTGPDGADQELQPGDVIEIMVARREDPQG